MTSILCLIMISGGMLGQIDARRPLSKPDALTPTEKSQLEREEKIDNRIRMYETISSRFHRSVKSSIEQQDLQKLEEELSSWGEFLSSSLKDVESNVNRKKKSRALIRHEIQLRKTIVELGDLKYYVPSEAQEQIGLWCNHAEEIRKKFVDILFER